MNIVVTSTPAASADLAAHTIAALLSRNPQLVLGLPTGRTPIPFYRTLVALHRRGRADFAQATTFNLDEFHGIAASHPGSYHAYMRRHLFDHVNLSPARTHLIDGAARDWRAEVARYDRTLARAGGLDVVVLGIGRNGHIGFNEPADRLVAHTHRVRLHGESRRDNAHLFSGRWTDVPTHALSMGLASILQARLILLVATGAAKARIVARALAGTITTRVPASLVRLHPASLAILDRAAAAHLPADLTSRAVSRPRAATPRRAPR
jgi:glucosamine-6-phosphate deaminase